MKYSWFIIGFLSISTAVMYAEDAREPALKAHRPQVSSAAADSPSFKGRFVKVKSDGFVDIHQERYPKFKGLQNVIQTFRRYGEPFALGETICWRVDPNPTLLNPQGVEAHLDSDKPYDIVTPEDTSNTPFFSCGRVDAFFPESPNSSSFTASGSAAAIDRNLLVTAAHNFLPPGLPGLNGNSGTPNTEKHKADTVFFLHTLTKQGKHQRGSYSSPVVTHCFIHPKWEESFDPHYDIAFFFLDEPMNINEQEANRLLKLRIVPPTLVDSIQVIGYPSGISSMTETKGEHAKDGKNVLDIVYHTANTLKGSSGSPIVASQNALIGVHTRAPSPSNSNYNRGVRIRHDIMPFLEECIASHHTFLEDTDKFLAEQEAKKQVAIQAEEDRLKGLGKNEEKRQTALRMASRKNPDNTRKHTDEDIADAIGSSIDEVRGYLA